MSVALSIVLALVVLGILIAIHELGHFGAGKLLGFSVLEYSIGMGPVILKKRKNETDYTLRLLPIGGMCRFEGEDEAANSEKCFNAQPVWKRMIVVLAGPLMNVIFAIFVGIILFAIFGSTKTLNYTSPQIVAFSRNAVSQEAGLMENDFVFAIDGVECATSEEMIKLIRETKNNYVDVIVLRPNENNIYTINGKTVENDAEMQEYIKANKSSNYVYALSQGYDKLTFHVENIYDEQEGYNRIGASISSQKLVDVRYGFGDTIVASVEFFGDTCKLLYEFLGSIFSGKASLQGMMGIVGIVDVVNTGVSDAVSSGVGTSVAASYIVQYAIYLMVLLSINLGVVNALPLPALDGGRFVFMVIEAIFRKPVPVKVEAIIHTVGFGLLMVLICFVTFNDIFRIAKGFIHLML